MARARVGQKPRYPPLPPEERGERPGSFSPGGRLLQIEYARECPQSGPLALAMKFRGGVMLGKAQAAEPELGFHIPLIWKLTPTIAYVANGNLGDMFYLSDCIAGRKLRSLQSVALAIRGLLHNHAVRTDVRPLALLILLCGIEADRPRIVGFDVTGSQFECNAWAFGDGDLRARNRLIRSWKPNLRIGEAKALVEQLYGTRSHETTVLKTVTRA